MSQSGSETSGLQALLTQWGDAPAVELAGKCISHRELANAANAAANHLSNLGLARGDVLAVWLPNTFSWLQLLFAAARLGVLVVPISTRYKAAEVRHLLEVSRARVLITATRFLDVEYAEVARSLMAQVPTLQSVLEQEDLERLLPWGLPKGGEVRSEAVEQSSDQTSPTDDLLCCFSTSGTTGYPKLATHGRASIQRHAQCVATAFDVQPADALLLALPLYGVFGFVAALATLAGGGRVVLMPVFDATEAAMAIARHRITHVIGSDAMFDAMLKVPDADFSTWRRGAQADFVGLPLPVTQRADALGIQFSGTYGSSECYALMAFQDWGASAEQRAKAGGSPTDPHIQVRIADPEGGAEMSEGLAGEIQIRGPNVLASYLNNPAATAKAFTQDGWYRSGDLGMREAHSFRYLARMGDSLRLRGYLVNPAEIENCLMQHESVAGAQVVGVNRSCIGDVAVAYVIATQSSSTASIVDEASLLSHCREHLAAYKVPVRIVPIKEFPSINGPNGIKIQKRQLREMANKLLEDAER